VVVVVVVVVVVLVAGSVEFVAGCATVAASEPLTNEAYAAGVDKFTDGVRSVALVVPLLQQITLPKEYTAMSAVAPNCMSAPPSN